jgi:hypothetical protein
MLSLWSEARTANLPIEMSADKHDMVTSEQSIGTPLGLVPMSDDEKKVCRVPFLHLESFFFFFFEYWGEFQS